MKLYMAYDVLLSSRAESLTDDEKARLRRIKAIPRPVFDAALARVEDLRGQVIALEAEMDEIIDYLNGEEANTDGN